MEIGKEKALRGGQNNNNTLDFFYFLFLCLVNLFIYLANLWDFFLKKKGVKPGFFRFLTLVPD